MVLICETVCCLFLKQMRSSETPEEEGGREIDMKEGDKSQQWVGGDRKGGNRVKGREDTV